MLRQNFKDTYPDIKGTRRTFRCPLRAERDALVKKQQEEQKKRHEDLANKKDSDKLDGNNLNFASSVTNLRGEANQIKTQLKLIDQDVAILEKGAGSSRKRSRYTKLVWRRLPV